METIEGKPSDQDVKDAPLPWERGGLGGERESDESFAAFDAYREMGLQRSLAKVAAALGKSVTLMERWNRRDNWQNRVRAWDRHHSRTINERVLAGTAAMRERAAGIGLNLQVLAAKHLLKLTDEELAVLTISERLAMIRVGTVVEASARAISPEEIEGAMRDSAPIFNIGFVQDKPAEMVAVRLESGEAGYIPRESVAAFQLDHPKAMGVA